LAEGEDAGSEETTRMAGKARNQAPSQHHIAAGRSLHGKEGVAGTAAQAEHLDVERHRDERVRRVCVTGFVPR
jgi:hypothetical protein